MAVFDDRQKAFENKFAHDEELKFKAMARRNKIFGLWVGGKLGKTGDALDAYAKEVVIADLEEAGDDDIMRKVRGDLAEAGISFSDDQLKAELAESLEKAMEEISE